MQTIGSSGTLQTSLKADGCIQQSDCEKPRILIASRQFGASNQPWLWRQVTGMSAFEPHVVCWKRSNRDVYPMPHGSVHVLDGHPAPYDGPGRWLYRVGNASCGNYYAAQGEERRCLQQLIEQHQPGCILCYFGDIALRFVEVAKRADVPLIAYFHGDFQFLFNRWYRWSLRRRLRDFAAVIVVNRLESEWMERNGMPESRVHVVPCGAPTNAFVPRIDASHEGVRFVMACRLVDEKGCDISIRAFARVAAVLPDTTLDIFGDGPMRSNLEQLVTSLGICERVRFHGYLQETEIAARMPFFDIFIQHSLVKEGSPVSIVEAMSCALPVIATPVGGIVDQVVPGETGFIVGEGDEESMAQAMRALAEDASLRRVFGQNGRRHAVEHFDAALLTGRLEAVVRDVIGRRKQSS